jgi:hypothetical protein
MNGLVMVCLTLFAAPVARAQDGFMEWLDKLSGPGPFYGFEADVRVFCLWKQQQAITLCFDDTNENIKGLFHVELPIFVSSFGSKLFDDTPADTRSVRVYIAEPFYTWRLHPSFDYGVGAGMIWFTGDGFRTQYRGVITPLHVSFAPFAFGKWAGKRWSRMLLARFDLNYVTEGFIGSVDFQAATKFTHGGEFLKGKGLVLDLSGFLR